MFLCKYVEFGSTVNFWFEYLEFNNIIITQHQSTVTPTLQYVTEYKDQPADTPLSLTFKIRVQIKRQINWKEGIKRSLEHTIESAFH